MMGLNHFRHLFLVMIFGAGLCRAEISDYAYVTSNGTVTITKYTGPGGNITIPGKINGLPVVAIGRDEQFEESTMQKSFDVMDYYYYYPENELSVFDSVSVSNVVIPDSVQTIGDFAFANCHSLQSIKLSPHLQSIGDYAFFNCYELQAIELAETIGQIGAYAFYNCREIPQVELPERDVEIGVGAFNECHSLREVFIPKEIQHLGSGAFADCTQLSNIVVEAGSESFVVVDGILYDKELTTLLACPPRMLPIEKNAVGASNSFATFNACSHVENDAQSLFSGNSSKLQHYAPVYSALPDSLTSIAPMAFLDCDRLTSISLPLSVTNIGELAFSSCRRLADVELPEGLVQIDDEAFALCTDLKSIHLPESVVRLGKSAFRSCDSLTNIIINSGLSMIEDSALSYCENLKAVSIPASFEYIGNDVFRGSTQITNISVSEDNYAYCSVDGALYNKECTELIAFPLGYSGKYIIPEGVADIRAGAFGYGCQLSELVLPDSITVIPDRIFSECRGLRSLALGKGIKSIGEAAFQDCGKLEEITIPESVTHIPADAFRNCGSLKYVHGAESVTSIGKAAFMECVNLKQFSIPDGVSNIAPNTFSGCKKLRSVTIPESVTSIGSGAFFGCEMLRAIELPPNLSVVEFGTFKNCETLMHVSIPEGVTAIGESAFENCYRLQQIEIPDSVSQIGKNAFSSCSLQELVLPSGITSIEAGSFAGNEFQKLIIPTNVNNIEARAFDSCKISTGFVEFVGDAPSIATNSFPRNAYDYPTTELHYWLGTEGWTNNYAGYKTVLRDPQYPDFIFRVENGEITIRYYVGTEDEIVIPDRILDLPVIKIESLSQDASSVTRVTLPKTILNMEYISFYPMLSHVDVEEGNPVFSSEDGMLFNKDKTRLIACPPGKTGTVKIPDTVRELEDAAFAYCSNLTEIEISNGVEIIPPGTFSYCTSLTNLVLPNTITEIGSSAFNACTNLMELILPAKLQHIGANTFSGCSNLRYMTIPDGVKTIEGYLFYECGRLESVSIPEGVTLIGNQAFAGCVRLRELVLPQSVTNIVHWPFSDCESLVEIAIPDGVVDLQAAAFDGCDHLERILFSPTHPTYSSLNGLWLNKDQTELIYCPHGITREVVIPASVTNIIRSALPLFPILVDPENANYTSIDGVLYDKECTTLLQCPWNISGTLYIPSTVTNISDVVWTRIRNSVEGIRVDKQNPVFSSRDGVLYDRDMTELMLCPKAKRGTIRIPASVTNDPSYTLSQGNYITTIIVDPDNAAFSSVDGVLYNKDQSRLLLCPRAKTGTLHIPSTVSVIDRSALNNCSALEAIKVNEENEHYSSHEGVLLNKSQTSLIRCPEEKEGCYVMPETVVGIYRNAFSGCAGLTEIKLAPNVETIRTFTFAGCTGLKRIHIPEDMRWIEEGAFALCPRDMEFVLEGDSLVTISDFHFHSTIIRF